MIETAHALTDIDEARAQVALWDRVASMMPDERCTHPECDEDLIELVLGFHPEYAGVTSVVSMCDAGHTVTVERS